MASVEHCGFTVVRDGEEEPCDREATGWRWYQGHDHEDTLDAACWEHENPGGRRMHLAEEKVRSAEALAHDLIRSPLLLNQRCGRRLAAALGINGYDLDPAATSGTVRIGRLEAEAERLRAEVARQDRLIAYLKREAVLRDDGRRT